MNKLNERQLYASEYLTGSVLVLAGAGSGKTTVIAKRYQNLIQKAIRPQNILLLTFTNKAAKEMKDRIQSKLPNLKQIKIMTYHSFCVYFLKHHSHYLGLKNNFNIYTSYDQKKVYHDVLKDMKIAIEDIDYSLIQSSISTYKNNFIPPEEVPIKDERDVSISQIYKQYQERMISYGAFDFDDLLYYTFKILLENESILHKCQQQFQYIMIDEYQDTNRVQYLITNKLSEVHGNLFVVGDDDQSIYGWRGADIENILNFKKDYPSAEIIKLEQNYRSTNFILKAANALIHKNTQRHPKTLYSNHQDGHKIFTFEASSPKEEASRIVEEIQKKRLLHSIEFDEFAVLFRTKAQGKIVEEVFKESNIPFVSSQQYDLYDRKEIKDVLAYLRLIVNLKDDMSLLRILNFPKRSITPKTVQSLNQYSMQIGKSLFESMEPFLESHTISSKQHTAFVEFQSIIYRYQEFFEKTEDLMVSYDFFLKDIHFISAIAYEEKDERSLENRIYYLNQFREIFKKYTQKNKKSSLSNFLTHLAIFMYSDKNQDEDFKEKGIHSMTVHGAKGLEFNYVYIIGMEDGLFPFHRENRQSPIEEERRLCYVAITRAKKELTLSLCVGRRVDGEAILSTPSPFLEEIPDEVIYRNYGSHLIQQQFEEKSEEKIDIQTVASKTFDKIQDILNNR